MFKYEKIIPFFDVDPMKVVWHGNYVKYFEEARCAFLKTKKLTYNDMEKAGFLFPVVELKIKYIHPCVFGQKVNIIVKLEKCENLLIFKYEIFNEDLTQKLCKAETRQMCVDIQKKESLFSIPETFQKKLGIK